MLCEGSDNIRDSSGDVIEGSNTIRACSSMPIMVLL